MQDHGFFHQALVYLAAGVLIVPVLKRLGLGSVLGYLIAGMAIGPWGLAEQARHRNDTRKLITLAQQGRQDLEQLLATEAGRKP